MREQSDIRLARQPGALPAVAAPVKNTIRRWSAAGIALGAVLITVGGFLSWNSVRQATEDANWVAHAYAVSAALDATLAGAVDIETGARGFGATGNEAFLEPFVWGQKATHSNLDALTYLTARSSQERRLQELRPQIDAGLTIAENIIAQRRHTGTVPPVATFALGKEWMDATRVTIDEMRALQAALLEQRTKHSRAVRYRATGMTLFSTLSGVLLLLVAGLITRREIGESAQMRMQLQALNTDLEERVAERTSAFQKSQQRLQGIFDSALDAIISVDEERRIVLFNEAAQKIFRCSAAQAMGRPIEDFMPQRFRARHVDHVRRFAETGVTSRSMTTGLGELWALRTDGEEFQIEASLSQTGGVGGKSFTVILRDLTEQRIAEKAQSALASIVTFSSDAIIGKNLDGIVTSWNPGAEKIYGYSAAEMIGQPITTLMPPDHLDDFVSIMQTIRRGESLRHYESVRVRKSGEPIFVSLSVSPIRDNTGTIIGASTIARDITDQKQSEQVLQENARLLDLAQVLVRDTESRIVLWNQGLEKLYGYMREEAVGSISHILLQTKFPEPLAAIEEKLDRSGQWQGELVHRRRDGSMLVVASVWVLHRDQRGHPVHILEANTDITQQKAAEQEIRRLNNELEHRVQERTAQLEAANKELEAFTYSVSHDLRAPLRHISGFSKMLLDEFGSALPSEAQHYLERILGGTRRMGMLVDDLLNLGRIGRQTLQLQVAGLRPIVDELIEELQPECADREIEWKIGEMPLLDCDPGLLKQVLQNLLSNALKFTRPRPHAIIEVGQMESQLGTGGIKSDDGTVIYIRDNGVGFSMKYADKLFGVFQRLHRQEDFDGTGVGLATVQRIIHKHGGRIWAEAELDKGATFYFTVGKCETNGTKTQSAVAGETL